jgi:RHS repeat-associated protein
VSGTSGSDEYFYVRDHLGSIRAVINDSGAERGRWNFGIWGERGANEITSSPVEAEFGYTGHLIHERSGLEVAPFRFYDPLNARWTSRDPIGENGGINLYGYVSNNPINAVDPWGLATAGSLHPSGAVAMAEIAAMEAGGTASPLAAAAISEPVKPVVSVGIFAALKEIYDQLKPAPAGPPREPPKTPMSPPGFPGDDCEWHHRLPREFKEWFEAAPRNLNIEEFTRKMPMQWHRGKDIGIHQQGYNATWRSFIEQNPGATRSQTLDFLGRAEAQIGFGP